MNDAQTWTLIGGFFALTVTMIGMTMRVVRAEISGLGGHMDTMDARFDGLERRLDHLDRDVQMIVNRLMEG